MLWYMVFGCISCLSHRALGLVFMKNSGHQLCSMHEESNDMDIEDTVRDSNFMMSIHSPQLSDFPMEWATLTAVLLERDNKVVIPLEWSRRASVTVNWSDKTPVPLKWRTMSLTKEGTFQDGTYSQKIICKHSKAELNTFEISDSNFIRFFDSKVLENPFVVSFQRRRRRKWEGRMKPLPVPHSGGSSWNGHHLINILLNNKSTDCFVKHNYSGGLSMFLLQLLGCDFRGHSNLSYASSELLTSSSSSPSSSSPSTSSSLSSSSFSSSSSSSLPSYSLPALKLPMPHSPAPPSAVNTTEGPDQSPDNSKVAAMTTPCQGCDKHSSTYIPSLQDGIKHSYISADLPKVRQKRRARTVHRVRLTHMWTDSSPIQVDTQWRLARIEAKVGVLVVVDNSIYRKYLQDSSNNHRTAMSRIGLYYSMVVSMIDQRFGTINEPHLRISVRMSGLLVFKLREDAVWLESIVDWTTLRSHGRGSIFAEHALRKLTKWISERSDLPEFDHAMLFTGYRLTNEQGATLGGMAYLKAICDVQSGNAISIVFDIGDFQCIKVATHELAHSLGAYHDGDRQQQHCRPDSNYIMSSFNLYAQPVMKNAFYFSTCSIQDMWGHLSNPVSECVRNDTPVYLFYDIVNTPPGILYNADTQCKLAFGTRSGVCKEGRVASIMCGQLWCSDPDKHTGCRTNTYMTALPGTECGHHMVCHLGECIADKTKNSAHTPLSSYTKVVSRIPEPVQKSTQPPEASRRDPVILSLIVRSSRRPKKKRNRCIEDQNPRYCEGLVRVNPNGCKRRSIRRYCCKTCRRHRRRMRKASLDILQQR